MGIVGLLAFQGEQAVPYVDHAEQKNAPKSSEELVEVHCSGMPTSAKKNQNCRQRKPESTHRLHKTFLTLFALDVAGLRLRTDPFK